MLIRVMPVARQGDVHFCCSWVQLLTFINIVYRIIVAIVIWMLLRDDGVTNWTHSANCLPIILPLLPILILLVLFYDNWKENIFSLKVHMVVATAGCLIYTFYWHIRRFIFRDQLGSVEAILNIANAPLLAVLALVIHCRIQKIRDNVKEGLMDNARTAELNT